MAFTVPEFDEERVFDSMAEFEEAVRERREIEVRLEQGREEVVSVTATLVPEEPSSINSRLSVIESELKNITDLLKSMASKKNTEGLDIGSKLFGESKGRLFSLEVRAKDYFCPDTEERYPSLSAAAQGVSGNRRSGWKFWKDETGVPIGETSGRFAANAGAGR